MHTVRRVQLHANMNGYFLLYLGGGVHSILMTDLKRPFDQPCCRLCRSEPEHIPPAPLPGIVLKTTSLNKPFSSLPPELCCSALNRLYPSYPFCASVMCAMKEASRDLGIKETTHPPQPALRVTQSRIQRVLERSARSFTYPDNRLPTLPASRQT